MTATTSERQYVVERNRHFYDKYDMLHPELAFAKFYKRRTAAHSFSSEHAGSRVREILVTTTYTIED